MRATRAPWPPLALTLALALAACGRSAGKAAAGGEAQGPLQPAPGADASAPSIAALPAAPDPCAWITLEEAKGVLGSAPVGTQRVRSIDNRDPEPQGRACEYDLAETGPDGSHARLILMVDPTGDLAAEPVAKILNQRLAKDAPGLGRVDTTVATKDWDASAWNIDVYHGRAGSLAVEIGTPDWAVVKVDRNKVERLAALVRDKVPDKPFATDHSSPAPDGDPCALLSPKDVEALVGPLALPPFRSSKGDPLFEPGGSSCTYWLGHHRALTIEPEWSNGKELFRVSTMIGNLIDSKLGLTGESADTLEGAWDQAATAEGALVVLKGEKMLSVAYQPAAVDIGVAARVAARALAVLARQ